MKRSASQVLTEVVEHLSLATHLNGITGIIAKAGRELTNSDGATFVLKDGPNCFYADESSIAPLWKGKRFPLESCISGWCMQKKQVVVIEDIYQDARIPHDAYRPTFVKSLCMVPVRAEDPIAAIGNYWANGYVPNDEDIKHLTILANSAAIAIENFQLKDALKNYNTKIFEPSDSEVEHQFETAIHSLAHDLRNPLSTMMLFAEMLRGRLESSIDPKVTSYVDSIINTGMHANEQIRKMLSLYSITDRQLEKKTTNLSDIATTISGNLLARAPTRAVNFDIEPDLFATADPHLISMVLENLLSNAHKYTCKKSKATIEFKRQRVKDSMISFYVRDDGDGFEAADSEKLFRPLVRLHDERDFPGTGLGLASAAKIIKMHGGSIRAEGKKSEGATFYIDLPA